MKIYRGRSGVKNEDKRVPGISFSGIGVAILLGRSLRFPRRLSNYPNLAVRVT